MPLNIRLQDTQTGRDYSFSPGRDIAYFWPKIVEMAYKGLADMPWEPWYGKYLQDNGVSKDDVLKALVAFSRFCMNAVVTEIESPFEALEKAGFFDCPLPAQLVVMTKIGQLSAGAYWAGIRDCSRQGEIPEVLKNLLDKAEELEKDLRTK